MSNSTSPPNGGSISPPNGDRVTQADLYKALYNLDQGLSERYTSIASDIREGVSLVRQLRQDFEKHREDGHPSYDRSSIVKEEIRLDAKKAALGTALLGFLTISMTILSIILQKVPWERLVS